jgi:hypothetical protein
MLHSSVQDLRTGQVKRTHEERSGMEAFMEDRPGQDMRTGQVKRKRGKFRYSGPHAGLVRSGHEDR